MFLFGIYFFDGCKCNLICFLVNVVFIVFLVVDVGIGNVVNYK